MLSVSLPLLACTWLPRLSRAQAATGGWVSTVAGGPRQGSDDGPVNSSNSSAEATLTFPAGVAVGSNGDLYFVEFAGQSVNGSLLSPPGLHCANACESPPCCLDPFAGNGSGLNGSLNCGCQSLDFYETSGHRLRVLRRASGKVETLAGLANSRTGRRGFRDGAASTAEFDRPSALAIEPGTGNVFIADAYNHRVRYWNQRTQTVSTVVGTG